METLAQKKCIPCEHGDIEPLSCDQVAGLMDMHQSEMAGWHINNDCTKMQYVKIFPDFVSAMQFVDQVAGIAESEGHHPDISIHYNKVVLDLWTHSIKGLSENDFIVAALIVQKTTSDILI